MQAFPIRRSFAVLLCVFVLAACSRTDDPPILQASLRSVTLASADPAIGTQLQGAGYQQVSFGANYPGTVRMHAIMWEVPEAVVEKALEFSAPTAVPSHARVLVMEPPARGSVGDVGSFYEKVLGVDAPRFPAKGELPAGARVHAWTFAIPDALEANRRLRENNIPVIVTPVGLTSPIFGDHKALTIRAPDGAIIELIETSSS